MGGWGGFELDLIHHFFFFFFFTSLKNGHFMVFDHNWGGGGQPEPYPYCKTPLFFKTLYTSSIILNLQLYLKKIPFIHLKHLFS